MAPCGQAWTGRHWLAVWSVSALTPAGGAGVHDSALQAGRGKGESAPAEHQAGTAELALKRSQVAQAAARCSILPCHFPPYAMLPIRLTWSTRRPASLIRLMISLSASCRQKET